MERTIRVTGKGKLSVKPDVTRLIFTLDGTREEYDAALRLSSESTDQLKTALSQYGFKNEDFKTTYFNVESVYDSYQDKDGMWKQRFVGYRFSHCLKLEFPVDNERLGKMLYSLGHSTVSPEIRIEYTISDPEAAKNELLAKAVADSRIKADILSKAAGVVLGEIVTIDYSWSEMEFVSRPMNKMMLCSDSAVTEECCNLNIEADDISVTDTVTVVWTIN